MTSEEVWNDSKDKYVLPKDAESHSDSNELVHIDNYDYSERVEDVYEDKRRSKARSNTKQSNKDVEENTFECPQCGTEHSGYPDECSTCGVSYEWPNN